MSDYINREMAADCIVLECDDVTLEQARQAIKDCPSADVVEVVRCKYCKYSRVADMDDQEDGYLCSLLHGHEFFSYDYCSYGERKDDEEYNNSILNARKGGE